jgi:AcrR family transcriptional regulator
MAKEQLILQLLDLFRRYGYEGATLSKIAKATGLGKASLYYHFPGGKEDMVVAVLDYLEQWLQQHILQSLRSQDSVNNRLTKMCEQVNELYQGGEQCCLFAVLLMGESGDLFYDRINKCLQIWIDEMATVLGETGLNKKIATERAEDAIARIQGCLILARGLKNLEPFQRTLQQIPSNY